MQELFLSDRLPFPLQLILLLIYTGNLLMKSLIAPLFDQPDFFSFTSCLVDFLLHPFFDLLQFAYPVLYKLAIFIKLLLFLQQVSSSGRGFAFENLRRACLAVHSAVDGEGLLQVLLSQLFRCGCCRYQAS